MNEESDYFEFEYDELLERSALMYQQVKNGNMPMADDDEYEEVLEFLIENNEPEKANSIADIALIQYPNHSGIVLLKADALLEMDNIDEAEDLIENAGYLDHKDVNTYLIKSDIAYYRNRMDDALNLLKEALENCDEDLDSIYLQFADFYEELERYEDAFESLKMAIDLNHDNEESFARLWMVGEIIDAGQECVAYYKKVIEESPFCVHAWYNLGMVYGENKMFTEAIDALEYVIAIDDKYEMARYNLGYFNVQNKDYKKAMDYFNEIEKQGKANPRVHFYLGLCYEMSNEMGKARSFYRKSLTNDTNNDETNYRIGRTYFKEDKIKNAIIYFEKAHRINKNGLKILQALALSYNKTEDVLKAIQVYQAMLELDPENCYIWINLSVNYFSANERKFALELLDTAGNKFPESAEIYYTKFLLQYESGRKKTALSSLAKGLELDYDLKHLIFDINPDLLDDQTVMNLIELYRDEQDEDIE